MRSQITWAPGTPSASPIVKVSRSGRRNMSLSNTRAKPSTEEPSNHSPFRTACGSRCTGMVMLFTVPSTSTKRRSRKRIERWASRSSVRSTVDGVARPAAASVFAVGHSLGLHVLDGIKLVPRRAERGVVAGSPGLVTLYGIVLHDVLLLFRDLKAAARASDSRLNGERANGSTRTN